MNTYDNLTLDLANGILKIAIDRPSKLNALNLATLKELDEVINYIQESPAEVKAVILTGAGEKAFVAGADISEFVDANEEKAQDFAKKGQHILKKMENLNVPVIAIVNGYALGGGCELAMAAHMRIAVKSAKFGQPEVNLGLIPGYGGTQRLTQLIGKGRAFEYLMTADMITAEKALAYGLVNHVTEGILAAHDLAEEILQKIMTKAPLAVGHVVSAVNAQDQDGVDGYDVEAKSFAACFNTADFKEGITAFIEKREATFNGQ